MQDKQAVAQAGATGERQEDINALGAQETGGGLLLLTLKRLGIDYLFANAGTDFPPILEAYLRLPSQVVPEPVLAPHELLGPGMAHGYYLATGRMAAVMLHTNVGLANGSMSVINAASDNVPVLVMSGRTPLTEAERLGARETPIHYGQEMYDQISIVRDVTKYQYEVHYPEQLISITSRACQVARDPLSGPVYLSLPREPLCETVPEGVSASFDGVDAAVATPSAPDAAALQRLATWVGEAQHPVILCQRGDPAGRFARALADFSKQFAIPVVQPFLVRSVLGTDDEMMAGCDSAPWLAQADLVLVVDCGVPWVRDMQVRHDRKVVHIGEDPNFRQLPVRGFQTDLALRADPALAIEALARQVHADAGVVAKRREAVRQTITTRRAQHLAAAVEEGKRGPAVGASWLSHCLSEIMDEDTLLFSELGVDNNVIRISGPNRIFCNPHSGGLGWAVPAALGAQLADRERLTIACLGDGSYILSNPVACHQVARAMGLPLLIIVKNNGMWNAVRRSAIRSYPQGRVASGAPTPLVSLGPGADYAGVASACGAYAQKVEHPDELGAALRQAVAAIRTERRAALIEVNTAVSDRF